MLFSRYSRLGWAAVLAAVSTASPTPVDIMVGKPQNDLVYREALEVAHTPQLQKRLSTDFSMDKTWDNDVLFAGSWVNADNGGLAEGVSLSVTCVECYTKGTVKASLTDEKIIDPTVRLDFSGVEAYVDIELVLNAGATYAVTLFSTDTPIGLGFPGLSVGVVFYVDLVFGLSEAIDLEAGFYVKLAEGSFLEASVFGGDIVDHFFDGISSKSLPVTVKNGRATFKADLRVRVQCGAEADIPFMGIGAGAELGIYANLIEFVAILEETPTCGLQTTEYFDLNVGAFAHLDVVVDWKTIGAIPTASTTLLIATTYTQCWIPGGSPVATVVPPVKSATASTYVTTVSLPPVSSQPPLESATESVSATASVSTSGVAVTTTFPTASGGDDGGLVTSTIFTTTTFTITSCAASVVNCPTSYQSKIIVTQTLDVYTTVCPATAVITTAPSSSKAASPSSSSPPAVVHVITDVVVLVPCSSPVVDTFSPPTPTPTGGAKAAVVETAPASKSTSRTTVVALPTSAPFVGVVAAGKEHAFANGTSTSAGVYGAGTGRPSYSQTAGPTASVVIAGAGRQAGQGVTGGLLVALVGALVLL